MNEAGSQPSKLASSFLQIFVADTKNNKPSFLHDQSMKSIYLMHQRAKNVFFARNSQAHVMVKPKLLLCPLEQSLKLWMAQPWNWDNVSASVFTNIHSKMPLWHIFRKTTFIVVTIFLPKTWASFQNLLESCCLRKLVWLLADCHVLCVLGEVLCKLVFACLLALNIVLLGWERERERWEKRVMFWCGDWRGGEVFIWG